MTGAEEEELKRCTICGLDEAIFMKDLGSHYFSICHDCDGIMPILFTELFDEELNGWTNLRET